MLALLMIQHQVSSAAPDISHPAAAWAERCRRRPADPVTFVFFFSTHQVSDRERQAQQVTADFFEELENSGQLYPNFRLGYDQAGEIIDPTPRRMEWYH